MYKSTDQAKSHILYIYNIALIFPLLKDTLYEGKVYDQNNFIKEMIHWGCPEWLSR